MKKELVSVSVKIIVTNSITSAVVVRDTKSVHEALRMVLVPVGGSIANLLAGSLMEHLDDELKAIEESVADSDVLGDGHTADCTMRNGLNCNCEATE